MIFDCLSNKTNQQKDFVLLTVPWTDSAIPLMAPAALKPIIEKAGLSCLACDLNVEIYNITANHQYRDDFIDFFFNGRATDNIILELSDMFWSAARQIVNYKPKYVGLSLFSYVAQHSAKWLAYMIKKLDPTIKIVIGGAGCLSTFTGASTYANHLIQLGIVDYHIRGDAENSLYELLTGNDQYSGINDTSWKELEQHELRSLPMPDYSDYIFSKYKKAVLPLVGSRGCVRQCTFCDYIANWKKFQWRTAEDIFSEMLQQGNKYNIFKFKFQDSLTNGNQKEFRRLLELVAEHNLKFVGNKITWSGYYIFRDVTVLSETEWQLLHQSGAENLSVGIENLNEHIRYAIGKKFSNKSIDYHLSQAKKHKIQIQLLNIVGYVNETQQDIDFIKQWLIDHVEFQDILYIQWGGTLGIFENTYLDANKHRLGIKIIGDQPHLWVNEAINSTPAQRATWAQELNELSTKLGYRVANNIDNHFLLESMINA